MVLPADQRVVANLPCPRRRTAAFAGYPPTRRPLSIVLSLTAEFCPPDDARDKLPFFASIYVEAGRAEVSNCTISPRFGVEDETIKNGGGVNSFLKNFLITADWRIFRGKMIRGTGI